MIAPADVPSPRLYMPAGIGGIGFLRLHYRIEGEWLPVEIELKPRMAIMLIVLAQARERDVKLSESIRGWRVARQLAKLVAEYTEWELEDFAVRAYLSKIHRLIQDAVGRLAGAPEALAPPELFERRRGLGARLAVDTFQVIDLTGVR